MTVVALNPYRETKETIAAAVRSCIRNPEDFKRFLAAITLGGAIMRNHGWRELKFPRFKLILTQHGHAGIRARRQAKEGHCPYCGSENKTWMAGDEVAHFGCRECGGVYKMEVSEDEIKADGTGA